MPNPKSRYIHCMYAEDARPELTGSFSVIGVLQGGIQVEQFPTMLPKLAVIAAIGFPPDDILVNSLKLEIWAGEQLLQSVEPPANFVRETLSNNIEKNTGRGAYLQLLVTIKNVAIEKRCRIEVRAIIDDIPMEGNGLEIILASDSPQ